ncbi:Holliday junction resolvase RecU [[Mycoplasma] cavipharyngis]|uniref:Holliday junction resolvase RecU n=1 Tax=[Mycoplasma] cavipharyngis TaxID=92757 RepID=UPI0037046397
MRLYQNRGMFTESLVKNSIHWYYTNNIAFFQKNHVPIKLSNVDKNNKKIHGYIAKSGLDYYGLYQGKYIEFEVKETENNVFELSQLKRHQLEQMQRIKQFQGISFLILNFITVEKIFFITADQIDHFKKNKISKITLEWCDQNAKELPIHFPGIIKWLDLIE